jgi:phosphonate transport system substrate-binding protein
MKKLALLLSFGLFALNACTSKKAELGSASNPVKLFFTPSVDAKVIEDNSKIFKDYLEKNTPYKFEVAIPQSYIAVVEAFGTKRADVAAINTFGYILAHDKYAAEARMTVIRHGSATYQAQFLAKADSKINAVNDFKGKKLAFVDASSTSGYLLPLKMLKDNKVEFGETVFAGKHDNVVTMIYQGQVDGGATFYSPPANDEIQDARRLVKTQYPDVEKKIKIVQLSEPIPNDPIIFRKDMPEEMKAKIIAAFSGFVATPEGKGAFEKLYGVTDIKVSSDQDYDAVRAMLKTLGKDANEMLKK